MEKKTGLEYIKELRAYEKEEWFKKLVDLLIYKKGNLSDKDRETIIGIILGDGTIEDIEDTEIENSIEYEETNNNFSLVKIHNITNVGALKTNSEITFSPNLTVVYGRNGAGKSSYFKALSVFSKRVQHIKGFINEHANNDSQEKRISVSYSHRDEHLKSHYDPTQILNTQVQEWLSTDTSFISDIKDNIEIYDNENTEIVIEKGKDLNWKLEPFKLHYFDLLIKEIEYIQESFNKKISENNKIKGLLELNLVNWCSSSMLTDFSNDPQGILDSALFMPLTSEEMSIYEHLKLQKTQINQHNTDKISLLKNEKESLLRIRNDLNLLKEKVPLQEKKNRMTLEYNKTKQEEELLQISALEKMDLAHINKVGWQDFIVHAIEFIKSFEYPKDDDKCIFCNQNLDKNSSELIRKYKNVFVEKNNNLEVLENELDQVDKKINQMKFVESRILSEITSYEKTVGLTIASLETASSVSVINSEQIQTYVQIIDEKIIEKQTEIDQYIMVENTKASQLQTIEEELKKFELKENMYLNKESFMKLKDTLTISSKYHKINNGLSTQKSNITKKQTQATTKLQIEKFDDLFRNELNFFNYKFNINSKVRKGRLDRKYFGENLSEILSEGEKNIIGLADFFADINYYENNGNPIILDDPITSFDLDKIDLLSERIIKESKKRQVIIFTHSKPFVTSLRNKLSFKLQRDVAKCKLCSETTKCETSKNIYCSKWYEVYSYNGLSGVLADVHPFHTPKHLKDRIENRLASTQSSTIDILECYLYLRLMIEYFIDTCLLNSVRSRLDPESDKILWDKLPGLKVLKDNDGSSGSNSIIRKTYSKISGISVHIDKENQSLSFDKSDLLYDLENMKNNNSDFKKWYDEL